MIAPIIFLIYAMALNYLSSQNYAPICIMAILLVIAAPASYYKKQAIVIPVLFVSLMVSASNYQIDNFYSLQAFAYVALFLVPFLVTLELTVNRSIGIGLPKGKIKARNLILPPLLFVLSLAVIILALTQNALYKTYFIGDDYAIMQILLLIAIGTLMFIPMYEYYDNA